MIATLALVGALSVHSVQDEGALLEAARSGDLERARALLEAGANVDEPNRYGATPLFFAADRGDLAMVRLLVDRGARADLRDSFYEMTPATRALMSGHEAVARFLLEETNVDPDPVLVEGARAGNRELVRAALATGRVSGEGFDEALGAATGTAGELLRTAERPERSRGERWTPSEGDLQALTGRYQNESTGAVVTLALTGESLRVVGDGMNARLAPERRNAFALEDGSELVLEGRGGMVERMVLRRGGESTTFRPYEESGAGEPAAASTKAPAADVARRAARPWPAFRGADRSGIADGQGVPLEWDAETRKNIRFATELPGLSIASPILSGGRIFLVTAVSESGDRTFRTGLYGDVRPVEDLSEHRWLLFALDARTGDILWERELHRGVPGTKRHTKSSQANATPVTDGERIVTVLGSAGIMTCHDVDGNLLWRRELGVLNAGWFYDPDYEWGHSSSPILYKGTVILQADVHGGSYLAAYSLETGEQLWRTERPDEIPTFATPAIYRGDKGDELVTNGTRIRGYDPRTGELLWHLGPNSELPVSSPIVTEDLIYVTAGYPPVLPIYAIRPGSRGDLTAPDGVDGSEALAWFKMRGGVYIPTPIAYRGYLYLNANNGRLTCYDAATGDVVYRERIGGVGGSYVASPIAADGRLYFTNEEGETFVVAAGPEYRLLGRNHVDGVVLATPAASDGLLVIRTLERIYGISE